MNSRTPPSRTPLLRTPPSRTPLLPRVLTFSEFQEEGNKVVRPGHLGGDLAGMEATLAQQAMQAQRDTQLRATQQRQRRRERQQEEANHAFSQISLSVFLFSFLFSLTNGMLWICELKPVTAAKVWSGTPSRWWTILSSRVWRWTAGSVAPCFFGVSHRASAA
jgi:hypothetical protein